MKANVAISTVLHIIVLGFGLISISSTSSTIPTHIKQNEPFPVSLVLLSDDVSIHEGELTTKNSQEKHKEHIDKNNADTITPIRLKQEIQQIEESEKFLSDVPNIGLSLVTQAQLDRTEFSVGEKQKMEIHQSGSEQAPIKQVKKSVGNPSKTTLLQKKPNFIPTTLPENVPLPNSRQKHIAKIDKQSLQELTKQPFSVAENEDAKNSQELMAFGDKQTIDDHFFQQTLNNIIGNCIQRNWNLAAINGSTAYDLRVIVHFGLNQDGTINGEANLMPGGGDNAQLEIISIQAREALKKCAPFSLPIEKYSQWREVIINMKAFPG